MYYKYTLMGIRINMEKKLDLRVYKTYKALHEAFSELLKYKSVLEVYDELSNTYRVVMSEETLFTGFYRVVYEVVYNENVENAFVYLDLIVEINEEEVPSEEEMPSEETPSEEEVPAESEEA